MNADGVVKFEWLSQGMEDWEAVSMRAIQGLSRLDFDALKYRPDKPFVLTEVEYSGGIPRFPMSENFLMLAALYTVADTMCWVAYDQTGTGPDCYSVCWKRANDLGAKPVKAFHPTIEAAMTDFCKELMLVNPYDHVRETVKERGINTTNYQSNEEFGSWA